jgi:Outer membrane protein beta-barrel domain
MSFPRQMPFLRQALLLSTAIAFLGAASGAQSANPATPTSAELASAGESSSLQPLLAADAAGLAALPAEPAPAGSPGAAAAAGQNGRYQRSHSWFNNLAFEAGGGFNAPTSDSSPYITWGGNFTAGVGKRFNSYLSLMAEYQFIDDKLPGAIIAETGANGGHAHIWSLTLDPVFDLFPSSTNSVYVTGGGGFYRKVTSFTDPEETEYCDYYYCYPGITNAVVGHYSSNQGGWNIGAGFTHRLGGLYGDSKMKLFAEVRYLDVLSPAVTTQPNGLGTTTVGADTKLIPVTLGVRW